MQSVRQRLWVEKDPSDASYRERYALEMIDGFRILSLLIFLSMLLLFVVHLQQPNGLPGRLYEGPSFIGCGLLACAGGLAALASRSIRSAGAASLATAALLVATVAVISLDRIQQVARDGRKPDSLLPVLLSALVLAAALLPLRPSRMLGLGALLIATSCLAAIVADVPFQVDLAEAVGAAIVVAVSVVTAARSTSHRIRVHYAHAAAIEAERRTKAARERALLAESAVTMERLAASLSHELNTPIGVLKSAVETLFRYSQRQSGGSTGQSYKAEFVHELSGAIADSTARLTETVARIQRFANLDRCAVRRVDVNQLVQDAVSLMNPPSANRTRVKLRLEPLPPIWCKPHPLSAALASVLNEFLENPSPVTIATRSDAGEITVRITQCSARADLVSDTDLRFSVVERHVRASGWALFAARQLIHQNGGELRVEHTESGERIVLMRFPADAHLKSVYCAQEGTA
jgi:signal transduction histidine kinase